jgi:hypothetical protein
MTTQVACAGTAPVPTCGGCSAMRCCGSTPLLWRNGGRCLALDAARGLAWRTFTPAASCTGSDCEIVVTSLNVHFQINVHKSSLPTVLLLALASIM